MISRVALAALALAAGATACAPATPTYIYVLPSSGGPPPPAVREVVSEPAPEAERTDKPLTDQRSPAQALRSFLWAFDAERYDLILRFIPDRELTGADGAKLTAERLQSAWEGSMRASVEARVGALRRALEQAPIDVNGEHATLPYGGGGIVELVKEGGVWKIQDL